MITASAATIVLSPGGVPRRNSPVAPRPTTALPAEQPSSLALRPATGRALQRCLVRRPT